MADKQASNFWIRRILYIYGIINFNISPGGALIDMYTINWNIVESSNI